MTKEPSFSASARSSTWSFRATRCPKIYDALKLDEIGLTLEVQQQLGDGVVRTIALGSSDGLRRGMTVVNTGKPITVPVGAKTLGRIMDVLGRPIDERGPVDADEVDVDPPPRADVRGAVAVDRAARDRHQGHRPASARSPRAARSACSAAPAWARPSR